MSRSHPVPEDGKRLSCRLPRKLDDELTELARSQGKSRSAVVREAVQAYVRKAKAPD